MMGPAAIVIPTLNEAAHIGALLAQCARLPADMVRTIVVADGGSADTTQTIVLEAAMADPRIRLVNNPQRIQSAGINNAVAGLEPTIDAFVRIDAHATYPDDYVPRVLAALYGSGADVVATRLLTTGVTPVQRAIAAASNSMFGTGGAAHRQGGYSGFIDHGHHAGFRRAAFERVGGYDATFIANEDAEFDARIRRTGGRIWMAGDIEVVYYPRRTLSGLARQYRRYGTGRAANVLKHCEIRFRQLLAPAITLALVGALLVATVWPPALIVPAVYSVGLALATTILVRRSRDPAVLLAFPAMAIMHVAWGSGFIMQIARDTVGRILNGSLRSMSRRTTGV